ncbi:MAG: hypothetical protein WBW61_02580 [Rhodanobacteraceae bacterium]
MSVDSRKRLTLIAIVLLFAAPAIAAWLLHTVDWQPKATLNSGTLLHPAQDLKATRLVLDDGSRFAWKNPPVWQWTLLALPGPDCAEDCLSRLDEVRRERLTLNQNASRLRVVVVDADLPGKALDALRPLLRVRDPDRTLTRFRARAADSVAAVLVDPNGFAILTYAAGYDGTGMRKDLARVVK